MKIDMTRIAALQTEYANLDPIEACYRKSQIRSRTVTDFPCRANDIIASALAPYFVVLDIGCGDGQTLAVCASRFTKGIGIDESAYGILQAREIASNEGLSNIEFIQAKAISGRRLL